MTSDPQMTPGSPLAIHHGCTCPRMDNAHGRGYLGGVFDEGGQTVFVYNCECPLHCPPEVDRASVTHTRGRP